jgi:hypothetical protein
MKIQEFEGAAPGYNKTSMEITGDYYRRLHYSGVEHVARYDLKVKIKNACS